MDPLPKGMVRAMARHVPSVLKSQRNFLLVAVGCIALVTPAFEQTSVTPPEAAGGRTFAYDVVSAHPCKLGSGMSIQSIRMGSPQGARHFAD